RQRLPGLFRVESTRRRASPPSGRGRPVTATDTCEPAVDAPGGRAKSRVSARAGPPTCRAPAVLDGRRRSPIAVPTRSAGTAAPHPSGRMMRRRQTDLLRAGAFLAGCLLLATLFVRLGPGRIMSLLTSLGWNAAVIVALFAAHELVRALAITQWLPADRRPPVAELLRIRLLGEGVGALTRTGSLAAEPTRAWLLANPARQGVAGYSAAAGELMANSATSAAFNVAVAGGLLSTAALHGPVVVLAHVLLWGSLVYLGFLVSIAASRVRLLGICA